MAFKLKSGNSGAFKALKKNLWKAPGAEEESTAKNPDILPENDAESGDESEARTTARSSDMALSQLISPKEKKKGGLENPRIRRSAEIRGQRYNQAVDSELGVEGVEGPGEFEKGLKKNNYGI